MPREKQSIESASYAKINLFLDIERIREDGYHDLSMVNAKISFHDTITCSLNAKPGIVLTCSDPDLPTDENNMAYQAAQRYCDQSRISKGVILHIEKRIPKGAGLGGGSSDAATVLLSLNKLIDNRVSRIVLKEIAVGIGADVPFFLEPGLCVCSGVGERVVSIHLAKGFEDPPLYGVLCSPAEEVSSKIAYSQWDNLTEQKHSSARKLLNALTMQDWGRIPHYLFNAFEQVVFKEYPVVKSAYKQFCKVSPTPPRLTGSGSNLFSLHTTQAEAEEVARKLTELDLRTNVFYMII